MCRRSLRGLFWCRLVEAVTLQVDDSCHSAFDRENGELAGDWSSRAGTVSSGDGSGKSGGMFEGESVSRTAGTDSLR